MNRLRKYLYDFLIDGGLCTATLWGVYIPYEHFMDERYLARAQTEPPA